MMVISERSALQPRWRSPYTLIERVCTRRGAMEIIPVLDLKGGVVVRARMGARHLYAPIATRLAATSDPLDVARGLLAVYPFATMYVADLDAIEGRSDNSAVLDRVKHGCPGLSLWVDNGIADVSAAARWLDAGLGSLVLGSETQADAALVRSLAGDDRVILSLDFRGAEFQGPPALLEEPSMWPARVIAMTLARVGSGAGPDVDRLAEVRQIAAGRRVYAAGGVRDAADLAALARAGIAGALVATALHDGRLRRADIDALAAEPASRLRGTP
jgi:phosphoribosylformimino-5-aminoimidazole carboxamide ribotide isomerase